MKKQARRQANSPLIPVACRGYILPRVRSCSFLFCHVSPPFLSFIESGLFFFYLCVSCWRLRTSALVAATGGGRRLEPSFRLSMLLRGDSSAAPSERVPTSPGGSGRAWDVAGGVGWGLHFTPRPVFPLKGGKGRVALALLGNRSDHVFYGNLGGKNGQTKE